MLNQLSCGPQIFLGGVQPSSSPHLLLTLKHHLWVNPEVANFFYLFLPLIFSTFQRGAPGPRGPNGDIVSMSAFVFAPMVEVASYFED